MNSSLRIKPFALAKDGSYIDDFDKSEMNEILDLFDSLGEKCQDTFNNLKEVTVEQDCNVIVINYKINKSSELSDDDFLFYVESLTGHNSDNIIQFGDADYVIMGEPVEDSGSSGENKKGEKKYSGNEDFLSKMTRLEKATKLK
jgi:hypothetical protein